MKRSRDLQEEVNSSFVNEQEAAIVPVAKVIGLDADRSNDGDSTATALQCSLPGHLPGLSFATYHEYESHYNNAHTNRCLECGKNFPSSHYLDLHIAECHDVLVEIRKDKGEAVYNCFVETCAENFHNFKKREHHLIRSHMFPSNYFFAVTKFGIDQRRSLLRNPKKEKQHSKSRPPKAISMTDTENPTVATEASNRTETPEYTVMAERHDIADPQEALVDTDMEDLTEAMSSMKFVPRTIRFGPKKRAGFARK